MEKMIFDKDLFLTVNQCYIMELTSLGVIIESTPEDVKNVSIADELEIDKNIYISIPEVNKITNGNIVETAKKVKTIIQFYNEVFGVGGLMKDFSLHYRVRSGEEWTLQKANQIMVDFITLLDKNPYHPYTKEEIECIFSQ